MSRDPSQSGTDPPFDIDELIEICFGDPAFAESIVQLFQQESESHLKHLGTHASQGNLIAACHVAHALQGSAAVASAGRVRRVAAKIESAGEQGRVEQVRQLVDSLGQEIRLCRQHLHVVRERIRDAEAPANPEPQR